MAQALQERAGLFASSTVVDASTHVAPLQGSCAQDRFFQANGLGLEFLHIE